MNGKTGIQWIQGSEEKSDGRKAGREGKAALYSDVDCKRTLLKRASYYTLLEEI